MLLSFLKVVLQSGGCVVVECLTLEQLALI